MSMTKSILRSAILILIPIVIFIWPLIVRAQTPIDCGQTLSASISASGERDSYTFSGSANDGITIRARKTSGTLTPYLELYGPGGGLITGAANKIDRTLTETGTYRIDVRDQNNTNTGDYLLYWERMNNPCNATPISCEQVVSESIGTGIDPPPWKVYTFTVSANDVVTIRSRKTSGGSFSSYMELYNPSGTFLQYGGQIDGVLTVTGTYTILMRDYYNAYAGDFTLVWRKVSTPCSSTPISCGQVVSGSITGSDAINFYTLTASANDAVTIRMRKISGTFTPYIEVYNPDGNSCIVYTTSQSINVTLTTAGTYKILIRDYNNVNTGDYLLYWERMNNPCNVAANLACEQVVSGSIGTGIDPPPWRVYTFTASANDAVMIRARKTSEGTFIPFMELYGPAGDYIAAGYNSPLDRVLTMVGTYKVLIRDFYNAYAGDFILVWWKATNPCNARAISCGQVLSGSLNAGDRINAYTFTASANDIISLRTVKASGTFTPYLELYNSSGSRIGEAANQIDTTLTATGTYTIFVRDQNYINTGSYTLKFQKNNNSCPEVTVIIPNGGEMIVARSTFTIRWSSTDLQGISSQEIRLSTDGGQSFPTVIASGLAGSVQTYDWEVPAELVTNQGRIRVTATDTSGINTPDDSDADFTVFQGAGRQYVYDELNRLIQVIYEDGRIVRYTYDATGNRITLTNE